MSTRHGVTRSSSGVQFPAHAGSKLTCACSGDVSRVTPKDLQTEMQVGLGQKRVQRERKRENFFFFYRRFTGNPCFFSGVWSFFFTVYNQQASRLPCGDLSLRRGSLPAARRAHVLSAVSVPPRYLICAATPLHSTSLSLAVHNNVNNVASTVMR